MLVPAIFAHCGRQKLVLGETAAERKKTQDWMAERVGLSPATENKRLTSIDPDFSIKNGTVLAPKCNQECNHDSADTNASPDRGAICARLGRAMRVVIASRELQSVAALESSDSTPNV